MFSTRSLFFKALHQSSRSLSGSRAAVRWATLFSKELNYMRFLKKRSLDSSFDTVIDSVKLDKEFGYGTTNLFFGEEAKVNFKRLFSMHYEDLTVSEKQQRTILNKELKSTINSLCLRVDIGKAIHERNTDDLIKLIGNHQSSLYETMWSYLNPEKTVLDQISQLPPPGKHEITYVSDYEFVHYPFLAPFKFTSLCRITNHLREKLEDMPDNFAGVLGTIPVALNEQQALEMGIEIENPEQYQACSFCLFNIAIVVTGHGSITFVPKMISSNIDIKYPIPKYIMHNGRVYMTRDESLIALPPGFGQDSQKLPTLESMRLAYSGYDDLPVPGITKSASRIIKAKVGDGYVYIVPEICLENSKSTAVDVTRDEFQKLLDKNECLFKSSSFTQGESIIILHALIAAGVAEPEKSSMLSKKVFKHDRASGETYIKRREKGDKVLSSGRHNGSFGLTLELFDEHKLGQYVPSENPRSFLPR